MIRNNQNGRRRGRGGARPPQAGGTSSSGYNNGGGNRIDVRQRGNATQLLEKYKALARDATQGGDRVQAEYYMQYADHYYRVLNEFRARDPQPAPRATYDDDDGDQPGFGPNGGQTYAPQNYVPQADTRFQDDDGEDDYDAAPRREAENAPRRDGGGDRQGGGQNGAPERQGDRMRNGQDRGQRQPNYAREPQQQQQRDGQQAPRYGRNDEQRPPRDEIRAADGNGGEQRPAPRVADAPRREVEPQESRREEPTAVPVVDAGSAMPGLPGPATIAAPVDAVAPEAAPAPKRRGRPRKVVAVAADSADA